LAKILLEYSYYQGQKNLSLAVGKLSIIHFRYKKLSPGTEVQEIIILGDG